MKSQDENNNIELQNNMNEISNQFIQPSQQYQTIFIQQQQQQQNQNISQKDGKNHSEKNQEKSVVVLIGMTGSGRTTLFNKICNAQENVGEGMRSITKQSILGKSAYCNEFYIIDTPGLGTQQKKINHAVGIWNAMQEKPLNKIIIILKFELLFLMVKQLLKQIIILRRYRNMVIVAVTHFDQCKQQQIDKQNIQNEMKKFGIQNVLFFQLYDSGQSICNQINQYLMNSIPIQIEITQEEFLNYFDLLDEPELEEDVFQLMEEISNISTKLRKMISNKFKFSQQLFEQSVDADDIYFKVQNEIKIYTQLLIQERKQIIQQLNKISNNQQYQETFNIDWFDSVEKLVEYLIQQDWFLEIKQLNQQALSYLSKNQASIINSLKVCQNCYLVWYCQSNSNNVHYCKISVQDEDNSIFDDQFWTTIQLFNTNDISTLEYQNKQQYIKEYIKKRNNQNISHGCGKQLDLLSINQNCYEYFYLSLDLFNQYSQYYLEQNKYIELLNLIQKVKQKESVKYLQF
ncbi:unnamed protein product [Paramecium pentaurelia]|uniref:G domain-containing protein n=1 Tax=Paramecium pentaurelia TaxID=43138 RepID=A0A8S1VQ45_9CILI|nr:unnamed protein product [Paramecium pentaurelia]